MICASCGTANEAGRKFCKECGAALSSACPQCGAPNTPDSKFCGECGTGLAGASTAAPAGGQAPPAAPADRAAERRLVTVLFADLVGFTTLAEGRDPEETRELLSDYFARARDTIERHGGTVEKFIGDAVMAVWGAPVAREDDAERAVRAALALVDGVRSLGPGIQARAGVLTGEAAVTVGASGEGMVAGDLVNTASRLQSVAPAGSVLVGETTERAANQAIQFEAVGEQALKGKSAPVTAYRAVRVVAEIGGKNRADRLEAPFVGRDDEFRLLKDLFHATGHDRRPRLVSVMGPAGIGKSRLAWEFSKYADGLVEDTYWHAGRAPSYGEGISFWPLSEMVRERAQLAESDDDDTTREKIHATVAEWIADEGERRWVETGLLALLGLGDALPGGRDELFSAWRTFFERIAERGTTVLLFEDLQWADSGMLAFIDHLLDWTKGLPLFVITLARPELLDQRPEWGAGRRNFVSLALDPLSSAHMRELLAGLAPGLPTPVMTTIVERADGIPLYAVEMVRMLVAESKLRERDGVYEPVGDISSVAIPETLAALIAARLDGLGQGERTILQDAAVLGQSFTVAALAAVSGVDAAKLADTLTDFVRHEILTLNADPRSPERGQYTFVQALIREVAYGQLARNERKTRHLAAARWFESLGDEELAGALAGHYAAAYRSAPEGPEADALAGQARIALRAAAERAASLGSHRQALTFFGQALELTHDPAERAALLNRSGSEARDEQPDVALTMFQEGLGIYRQLGDLRGIARAALGVAGSFQDLWRTAEGIPVLEEAVGETAAIDSEPEAVALLSELARAYSNVHDPKALELIDTVLERAERLDDMQLIAEAIINRALVLTRQGRHHEPLAILRGVLPLTQAHNLVWSEGRALNNLAAGMLFDDPQENLRIIGQGQDLARRTGNIGMLSYFNAITLEPLLELGRWPDVERMLGDAESADISDPNLTEMHLNRAFYLALKGEDDAASTLLSELQKVFASASFPGIKTSLLLIRARVDALGGRLEDSIRLATEATADNDDTSGVGSAELLMRVGLWLTNRRAVGVARQALDDPSRHGRRLEASRHQARAVVAALDDRPDDALVEFRKAIELLRHLQARMLLALCLTDMAIALPPSQPGVTDAAAEAGAIWAELGSPPMLARLDAGLARWQSSEEAPVTGKQAAKLKSSASV